MVLKLNVIRNAVAVFHSGNGCAFRIPFFKGKMLFVKSTKIANPIERKKNFSIKICIVPSSLADIDVIQLASLIL